MKDLQREILSQVAAGKISATEGAARLESLDAVPQVEPETAGTSTPAAVQTVRPLTRMVKVVSIFGSAEIVGDPSVTYVVADGPHRARQDGDTMVIEHTPFYENQTFAFGNGERRVVINGVDLGRRNLIVRVNPDVALAISVQAGNVRVEGVHGPITGDVQAGNCRIGDFRSTVNMVIQAGNIDAVGRLDSGASKIRCEMGAVKLKLEKGSSVRITARTTMGKVAIEGEAGERATIGPAGKDVTIGRGAGTLDVECTMGIVRLSAD